uniref:DNA polymerase beta n=1 Tax=African swine fever virus (isolate Tick/South Africa/Pretoriuskop Pr4/1996) TaxID=561443 RepID=DPOL_ASFP4|nr:RecName: Full=DNA polymerase beta [African swine fever virus tick/South Africa/Pretoriuskop Pr4/1996]
MDRSEIVARENPVITQRVTNLLQTNAPLLFMPIDIHEVRYGAYTLFMYGSLENGYKAEVRIENIPVFFDVQIESSNTNQLFLKSLLSAENITYERLETLTQRPVMGYREKEKEFAPYIRIFFKSLYERRKAITYLNNMGYNTAADDTTCYYRMVSRELKLPLTSWIQLQHYSYEPHGLVHRFSVTPEDLVSYQDDGPTDHSIVMAYDIETYSPVKGTVPDPNQANDVVFMICMRIFWIHSTEPLASTCITMAPCKKSSEWTTILCSSEKNLLLSFAEQFSRWAPDICTGFNDSRYDWPFIVEKSMQHGILEEIFNKMSLFWHQKLDTILKCYYVKEKRVKISAEKSIISSFLHTPGCLPIDVRNMCMQLYPKAEKTSLKAFLENCGLDSKVDLPYHLMWKYYETRDSEKMADVAYYCIIDAQRCQDLLVRHNVIPDRREVGILSYTSLYDCIYYAGGHKVCNMLIAYAIHDEYGRIACSTIARGKREHGKYPGAFVIDPVKGLEQDKPTTGLDFASLYPSLIMAYNFSPEKFVASREEANSLMAKGESLHYVSFYFNNRLVEGWFVRHNNVPDKMGLYPKVLIDLLNKRTALKQELKKLGEKKECIHESHPGFKELQFRHAMVDAKQKALKIFMNTFYGEAGNNLSPFFLLPLAGGVTSSGQYNLKLVYNFVINKGYGIKYGDTDSLYITCPDSLYTEVTDAYLNSQKTIKHYEQLCHEKVLLSMKAMSTLCAEVNEYLRQDNGTSYLRMAYEEVLFPVCFTGKKKYYGIAHVNTPNFNTKELFIRGIDIIKQGQTKLTKTIGTRIMEESMKLRRPEDHRPPLIEIVKTVLKDAVVNMKQWNFEDFIQTDAWRPDKDNKAVQIFMSRMHARREQLKKHGAAASQFAEPEPGERFSYVIVEKQVQFDIQGHRTDSSRKGDKMEYVSEAKAKNLPIDILFYINNYVLGLCARFINENEEFQPPDNVSNKDEYAQRRAKSYLQKFVQSIHPKDKSVIKQGIVHRQCYKYVHQEIKKKIGIFADLYKEFFNNTTNPIESFIQSTQFMIQYFDGEQKVNHSMKKMIEQHATASNRAGNPAGNPAGNALMRAIFTQLITEEKKIVQALYNKGDAIHDLLTYIINNINYKIATFQTKQMLTFEFSSTHVELLLKLNKTWLILAGIHVAKKHLQALLDSYNNEPPSKTFIQQAIEEECGSIKPSCYDFIS